MNGTRPMWPMGMSLCCYCRAFLYSLKIWKRYGAENLRTVCIYAIEYWLVTVCVCVCVCVGVDVTCQSGYGLDHKALILVPITYLLYIYIYILWPLHFVLSCVFVCACTGLRGSACSPCWLRTAPVICSSNTVSPGCALYSRLYRYDTQVHTQTHSNTVSLDRGRNLHYEKWKTTKPSTILFWFVLLILSPGCMWVTFCSLRLQFRPSSLQRTFWGTCCSIRPSYQSWPGRSASTPSLAS